MGKIFEEIHRILIHLFSPATTAGIEKSIKTYLEELQRFNFSFANPLFGLLILIALLFLAKVWGLKKAFSYCLTLSLLLCLSTIVGNSINFPINGFAVTYADFLTFITFVIIGFITVYYCLIKTE
jgi:hypothetical protein